MNIEKSKRSWFFFAIYTITYLYLVLCLGYTLSNMLDFGRDIWSCTLVVMVILLALAGCVAAFIILVNAESKENKEHQKRVRVNKLSNAFFAGEILPAFGSYFLILLSRGLYLGIMQPSELTGNVRLYETITQGGMMSGGGGGVGLLGAECLYGALLQGFCTLLGNDPIAVYILNLVCQAVLVVACYLFLRTVAGKVAAITGSLLFLCIPYFYQILGSCDPAQFYMALCAVLAYILASLVKRDIFASDAERRGDGVYRVLAGILTGILLMLDMAVILIPISGLVVFLVTVDRQRSKLISYVISYVISTVLGMAAAAALLGNGMDGAYSVVGRSVVYMEQYFGRFGGFALGSGVLMLLENMTFAAITVTTGIAAVMFFWCKHDFLRVTSVPYMGIVLLKLFPVSYLDVDFIIFCVMIFAVAVTITMVSMIGKPVIVPEKHRDEESDERPDEQPEKRIKKQPEKRIKKRPDKQIKASRKKKKEQAHADGIPEQIQAQVAGIPEQTKAHVQVSPEQAKARADVREDRASREENTADKKSAYIENPLPVPKKHVHREMDYGYAVPENQMHYDVSVAENDNFDQ